MGKAINGKFENMDQARNTRDDLIGSEIPQDVIFIPESVTSLANIPVKPTSAPTRGDNWVRF